MWVTGNIPTTQTTGVSASVTYAQGQVDGAFTPSFAVCIAPNEIMRVKAQSTSRWWDSREKLYKIKLSVRFLRSIE